MANCNDVCQPSFAKASEGILLRGLAGRSPAKRLGAKQDGGGGRTRTCEVIRRLIYSQLPLPLGTLPRPTASAIRPPKVAADRTIDMALGPHLRNGARSGAFMGKRTRKVNQGKPANRGPNHSKRAEIARIRNP